MHLATAGGTIRGTAQQIARQSVLPRRKAQSSLSCLKTRMQTLQKCVRIISSKEAEELPRTARGAFSCRSIEKTCAKETQRKEMYEQQRKTSRIDSVSASTETETPVYALGNSRWNYPRNGAVDSGAIMCFQGEKHNHPCPV